MVEDVSRVAFVEGSFGAGRLNEQICSKFSRNSSVIGKRYVHFFAHNEGGTALISPFTQFVCVKGLIYLGGRS